MPQLDIIILGASGFTGSRCIPYMHKLSKYKGNNFSWGIAGRSEAKLKKILEDTEKTLNENLSHIPLIICDIENDESLFKMAQKTRLVINCVGPYIIYGEKIVDACLRAGCHQIDVSGEPHYMEKIELTKNSIAKEKGVYVISACGVDSIPVDLGIVHLAEKFNGVLNSVVTYLTVGGEGKETELSANYTSWESLVHNLSRVEELKNIRAQLFDKKLPELEPKLKISTKPSKAGIVDGWVLPFAGADRSVVKRTQKYFYEFEGRRPIQVDTLLVLKAKRQIFSLALISSMFLMLSKSEYGRQLLLKHPKLFSLGYFSKGKPSDDMLRSTWFEIIFIGEGWKDSKAVKEPSSRKPCDRKIVAKVKGPNPFYGSTCVSLVAAAITVLAETDNLAGNGKGGVYTPGAAFAKTSLMEILNKNDITFDIISEQDIVTSKL